MSGLLETYGRFYGEEHFAIAFTASIEGDGAKRVVTRGWDQTKPLPDGDFGAGYLATSGFEHNIAIVLRSSNLIALESDSEPDLVRIEELGLPQTLTVRSSAPYKRHFYFRPPEELEALPYVAFRFESGKLTADSGRYFLAPPSIHPSGTVYSFLPGLGPGETDIVELPEHIYRQLCEQSQRETSEQRKRIKIDPEAKILAGQRRDLIFRYACMLRRWGRPYDAILADCLAFNAERCEPPVSNELVRAQVLGAMKKQGDQELPQAAALELRIVPLAEFAAVDEPGAEAILGTADNAVIPEGGDAMVYGDGGVGKTTLVVDLACHLAAGDDWVGLSIPRAVRVLLVENEGPRPLFRRKLERKLAGWTGSPIDDRVQVLEEPWGDADLADPAWRDALARAIAAREIDVVAVGPLTTIGMEGAGTIAEARAFLDLVDDVRTISGRPIAVILVHHENKGGKVSGAWEGAGDTLLHVQQQSHGHIRLYFQKARWASEQHATTLQLVWAEGDSFRLAEPELNRPEEVWTSLEQFVRKNGGCTWNKVTTAKSADGAKLVRGQVDYLARRRDQMLADGVIMNVGKGNRFELWHRDDPARPLVIEDEPGPIPGSESFGKSGDSDLAGEGFPEDRFPDSRLKGESGFGESPAAGEWTDSDLGKSDEF